MSAEIPVLAELIPSYVSQQEGQKRIDAVYAPIQRELKAINDTPKDLAIKTGGAFMLASAIGLASVNTAQAADLLNQANLSPDSIRAGQIALAGLAGAATGVAWELVEQRGIQNKNWVEVAGSAFLGATVVAGGDFIYQSGSAIVKEKNWFEAAKFAAIPTVIGSGYLFYKTKEISKRIRGRVSSIKGGIENKNNLRNYIGVLRKIDKLSKKQSGANREALSELLQQQNISIEKARADLKEYKKTGRISDFNR